MVLSVLFLGDDNSCRSLMGEGIFCQTKEESVLAKSAGLKSGHPHPIAIQVMSEIDIDISSYESKPVSDFDLTNFDLVVTVSETAWEYAKNLRPTGVNPDLGWNAHSERPLQVKIPILTYWNIPYPEIKESEDSAVTDAFRVTRDTIVSYAHELLNHYLKVSRHVGCQHLEDILDLLDEGVVVHSRCSRRVSLFNTTAERITGYSRSDVIGRPCQQVFVPDGLCASLCKASNDSLTSFRRFEDSLPFVSRDGSLRQLRIVASATDPQVENPGEVVISLHDVTELSELKIRVKDLDSFENIVGVSKAMQDVFTSVRQVSVSDYPVLISGDSGTGKELVARAIHNQSRRKAAPFVPINCGALPDHILESELFGHVRGAFTGATRDRKGRFQLADKGTVFLDEVGELSQVFQVKLLRILQEMRFEPVGGEDSLQVDIRVISATNRNLRKMVEDGEFREDLFYRICVMPIELPRLRERTEDIPFLVKKILTDIKRETGKEVKTVSNEAMDVLMAYSWPGNVRELINALRFASIRCADVQILSHHLPTEICNGLDGRYTYQPAASSDRSHQEPNESFSPSRRSKLTSARVEQALSITNGNKLRAAKLLNVSRATLYRFLDR